MTSSDSQILYLTDANGRPRLIGVISVTYNTLQPTQAVATIITSIYVYNRRL